MQHTEPRRGSQAVDRRLVFPDSPRWPVRHIARRYGLHLATAVVVAELAGLGVVRD